MLILVQPSGTSGFCCAKRNKAQEIIAPTVRTRRFIKERTPLMIELTGRREFNQASPDESSCETGCRRSCPTICWACISERSIERLFRAQDSVNDIVCVPNSRLFQTATLGFRTRANDAFVINGILSGNDVLDEVWRRPFFIR